MPRLVATAAGWIAGASVAALLLRALQILVFGFDILSEEDWSRLLELVETGNYTLFASWRSMTWPLVSLAGLCSLAASAYGLGLCAALVHDRLVELATEPGERTDGRDARPRLPWQIRHPRLEVFLVSLGIIDRAKPAAAVLRQQRRPMRRTGGRQPLPQQELEADRAEPAVEPLPAGAVATTAEPADDTEHRSRPPRPWSKRGAQAQSAGNPSAGEPQIGRGAVESTEHSAADDAPRPDDAVGSEADARAPSETETAERGIDEGHRTPTPSAVEAGTIDPGRLVFGFRWLIERAASEDHNERTLAEYHAAIAGAAAGASIELGPEWGSAVRTAAAACLSGDAAGASLLAGDVAAACFRLAVGACVAEGLVLPERTPAADPELRRIWDEMMTLPPATAVAPEKESVPLEGPIVTSEPSATEPQAEEASALAPSAVDSHLSAHDEMVEDDSHLHRVLEDGDLVPPPAERPPPPVAAAHPPDDEDAGTRGAGQGPSDLSPPASGSSAGAASLAPPDTSDSGDARSSATRPGRGRRAVVDIVAGELARSDWKVFRDVGLGETVGKRAKSLAVADLVALSADRLVVVIVSGLRGSIEVDGDIWSDTEGEAFGPLFRARCALEEADANLAGLAALRRHRREALVVLDSCRPSRSIASGQPRILLAQIREGAVEDQVRSLPTPLDALGGPAEPIHRTSEAFAIIESREETEPV